MANFLDYQCPNCSGTDEINVVATIKVRLKEDGTGSDSPEHNNYQYGPFSPAFCQTCGFEGKFHEFEPVPTLLEALQQALAALNTAPRFLVPTLSTNSYIIAALCSKAIKAAKGG